MLKLILIPIFLIITSFSQAKEYEYQQFTSLINLFVICHKFELI